MSIVHLSKFICTLEQFSSIFIISGLVAVCQWCLGSNNIVLRPVQGRCRYDRSKMSSIIRDDNGPAKLYLPLTSHNTLPVGKFWKIHFPSLLKLYVMVHLLLSLSFSKLWKRKKKTYRRQHWFSVVFSINTII